MQRAPAIPQSAGSPQLRITDGAAGDAAEPRATFAGDGGQVANFWLAATGTEDGPCGMREGAAKSSSAHSPQERAYRRLEGTANHSRYARQRSNAPEICPFAHTARIDRAPHGSAHAQVRESGWEGTTDALRPRHRWMSLRRRSLSARSRVRMRGRGRRWDSARCARLDRIRTRTVRGHSVRRRSQPPARAPQRRRSRTTDRARTRQQESPIPLSQRAAGRGRVCPVAPQGLEHQGTTATRGLRVVEVVRGRTR